MSWSPPDFCTDSRPQSHPDPGPRLLGGMPRAAVGACHFLVLLRRGSRAKKTPKEDTKTGAVCRNELISEEFPYNRGLAQGWEG